MESIVLEDWLRVVSSSASSASSSTKAAAAAPQFPANAIVHAWAQIRAFVQQRKALTSSDSEPFELLNQHRRSLHLADSQAKLLRALLSEVSSSDAALIGFVRKFAILGLLAWIRKSFSPTGGTTASGTTTPIMKHPVPNEALASVVRSILKAMEDRPLSDQYTSEGILLLGTISSLQTFSAAVRNDCLTAIAQHLAGQMDVISKGGATAEALAGAGYALAAASSQEHFVPIFQGLLLLWTQNPEIASGAEDMQDRRSLNVGLGNPRTSREQDGSILKDQTMVLHLMDFMGSTFLSKEISQTANVISQMELMQDIMLRTLETNRSVQGIQCASMMASVGLLRSLYRWDQVNTKRGISSPVRQRWLSITRNLENIVINVCEQAVTPDLDIMSKLIAGPAAVSILQAGKRHLCRCTSVAVSRCRGLPAHPCILRCLLFSIFGDALSLDTLYSPFTLGLATGSFGASPQSREENVPQEEKMTPAEDGGDWSHVLHDFQVHVDSFFLKEIGAIARAMCDQYQLTSGDLRAQTEQLVSQYACNMYERHRLLVAVSKRFESQEGWSHYRQTLEKVLEAAFLTVVIFFSLAVKEPVPAHNNGSAEAELAALALDSLSCVEYFRHVQLREFSKVVQRSVTHVARSEAAAVFLARLFPAYDDIIKKPGTPDLNLSVSWGQDEVQTARVLFYFRVMPLCLIKMPEATFAAEIAPAMYLYLQHPSETVSKASHGLFAAVLSLGARSESPVTLGTKKSESTSSRLETQVTLREQLVVYYMERALQGFPGVTPFEGLVAGAGAIARQLPAGSPATVYCLECLVQKTDTLYSLDGNSKNVGRHEGKQSQKGDPEGTSDQQRKFAEEAVRAAQKLQILLLHLILLVDLQVLPVLLKFMAKLILGLPKHFQIVALTEAYDVAGCANDYTRKPIIVPWLQSLSFLSSRSQSMPNERQPLQDQDENTPETRSVKVSNPESASKSKSVDVTKSENVVGEIREDGKQISDAESGVEGKKVAPASEVRNSGDTSAKSMVSENEVCSTEQAGPDDKGLEPMSKL